MFLFFKYTHQVQYTAPRRGHKKQKKHESISRNEIVKSYNYNGAVHKAYMLAVHAC